MFPSHRLILNKQLTQFSRDYKHLISKHLAFCRELRSFLKGFKLVLNISGSYCWIAVVLVIFSIPLQPTIFAIFATLSFLNR